MKITTQIAAADNPQALTDMIQQAAYACNHVSRIAFQERIFRRIPLIYRTYHEIRDTMGLPSALTLALIRRVAASYTNPKRRNRLTTFSSGSLPLYGHRYRQGELRCYGLRLPITSRAGVLLPLKAVDAVLVQRDGRVYIHQPIEVSCPEPITPQGFLGVDLGIVNIAVDSDGDVYSGGHLNGLRYRHARLRQKLQHKGTKSAKRLLQKRRQKERRFASWVNHTISKSLVNKARRHSLGIAIENLKGVTGRVTVRHGQRRQHHAWAFQQLRGFLEYKAALAGIPLIAVDPRNTSRTCPECGFVSKANRVSQAHFLCGQCGAAGFADHFAAMNIRARGGAVGGQPHVAA